MKSLPILSAAGLLAALGGLVAGCHVDELLNAPGGQPPASRSPPARLAFTIQPDHATAGQPIAPAVRVTALDSAGRPTTSFESSVTVALDPNPSGATLEGTKTVSAVNGVATFADLRIDQAGTGYALTATTTGLAADTTGAFNVTPGAATRLAFTVQPSRAMSDSAVRPPVQLTAFDSLGNKATSFTGVVTVALGNDASVLDNAKLSGSKAVAAVGGVATFADLSIDEAGNGYTLTAAFGSGAPVIESAPFDITVTPNPGPAPATLLAFTVQPSNTTAGATISPAVRVAAQDDAGNTVTTFSGAITVALATNPSGGTLSGTKTVSAVNGVATFADLSIDKAGTGYTLVATASGLAGATSAAFNATAPPPPPPPPTTHLGFTQQPTTTQVGEIISPPVRVAVQDDAGTTVTTFSGAITVALGTNPSGGTLSGTKTVSAVNGVATFADLSIDQAGSGYTLRATASGLTAATSAPFDITAPPPPPQATRLAFTVQPSNTTAGATISPAVRVAAQDDAGNTVTTFSSAITVALGTNPSGGTLSGTKTVSAVNGVATFADLSIDQAGSGYTLRATASGLTAATSAPFDITAPPPPPPPPQATRLAFTVQPSNTTAGATISPAVRVAALDDAGNTVTTFSGVITVALGTNPSGGTLSGTKTVSAVNGVATFADLSIDRAGTGYTLRATASGLTAATSAAFDVTAPPPPPPPPPPQATRVAFTVQPSNTLPLMTIQPPVEVTAVDDQGNRVTSFTGSVTIAIGRDASLLGNATLSGTKTVAAVNGVARFADLSIDQLGNGYTLRATAVGLAEATSSAFNIGL